MSRNKLPERKRKRIIKKYVLLICSLCFVFFAILTCVLLLVPKQSFVSPLPKTVGFQTETKEAQDVGLIKHLLSQKAIEYQTVAVSGSSYVIILKDGQQVTLSLQKNIDGQISSLQFILSRLTME